MSAEPEQVGLFEAVRDFRLDFKPVPAGTQLLIGDDPRLVNSLLGAGKIKPANEATAARIKATPPAWTDPKFDSPSLSRSVEGNRHRY